jgi:hypothetical protein
MKKKKQIYFINSQFVDIFQDNLMMLQGIALFLYNTVCPFSD